MPSKRTLIAKVKARVVGRSVSGEALVSTVPISFLGDVDKETGVIISPENPLKGVSIANRILVVERTRGSTVGIYVLYALAKRGRAPKAIVASKPDPVVIAGSVLCDVTYVYGVPRNVIEKIRCGDLVDVDAEIGEVMFWRVER